MSLYLFLFWFYCQFSRIARFSYPDLCQFCQEIQAFLDYAWIASFKSDLKWDEGTSSNSCDSQRCSARQEPCQISHSLPLRVSVACLSCKDICNSKELCKMQLEPFTAMISEARSECFECQCHLNFVFSLTLEYFWDLRLWFCLPCDHICRRIYDEYHHCYFFDRTSLWHAWKRLLKCSNS